MDKTLQDFGADVQWDDYAQMFTIAKDGAFVKVKPGENRHRQRQNPEITGAGGDEGQKSLYLDTFINDVFQSGLDQTFQVEKRPHPLNALSADEIKQAVEIVKASADFKPNTRFTQIALAEPESQSLGLCAERHGGGFPRQAKSHA
jgi:primary-amine oxidase